MSRSSYDATRRPSKPRVVGSSPAGRAVSQGNFVGLFSCTHQIRWNFTENITTVSPKNEAKKAGVS